MQSDLIRATLSQRSKRNSYRPWSSMSANDYVRYSIVLKLGTADTYEAARFSQGVCKSMKKCCGLLHLKEKDRQT